MPAVLAPRFTAPVLLLMLRPAVLLYVPPVVPVRVTLAVPLLQKGEPP